MMLFEKKEILLHNESFSIIYFGQGVCDMWPILKYMGKLKGIPQHLSIAYFLKCLEITTS